MRRCVISKIPHSKTGDYRRQVYQPYPVLQVNGVLNVSKPDLIGRDDDVMLTCHDLISFLRSVAMQQFLDLTTLSSKRDWSFVDSWNVFALATAKKWPLSPATSPASTRGECPSYSRGSSPNRIRQLSKNLCWPATARWPDVARTIVVDNCGRRSWCYGKITVPGPTLLVKHAADSLFLSLDQPHPSAGAGWRFALGPE